MRILFVNAERSPKPNYISVGPAYISAQIKKHFPSTELSFCNQEVYRHAALFRPDLVLVSSVSESYPLATQYARFFSEQGLPVVLGGSHITAVPSSLGNAFSLAVIGEGEHTILDVLTHYLENGKTFRPAHMRAIQGIAFREGRELVVTPAREPIDPLDSLPLPDRSIFSLSPNYPIISITSRGCPYRCIYCASSNMQKGIRYHGVDYVIEEVSRIVADYRPYAICFNDDLFCADFDRVESIRRGLHARGITKRTQFIVTCRANLVTDELAGVLKGLNTKSVSIGFESGSQRVLKYLKGVNADVETNRRAVAILRRHDIRINGFFIIGTPIDTAADLQATYDFVHDNLIDLYSVYPLTPLPGTPLWGWSLKKGLVSEGEDMDWSLLDLGIDRYIHLPEAVSRSELREWFARFHKLLMFRLLQGTVHHFLVSPIGTVGFLLNQAIVMARRIIEKRRERAGKSSS